MSSLLADARFLFVRARRPGPTRLDQPAHARLAREPGSGSACTRGCAPIAAATPLYQPDATPFAPFALPTAAAPPRASVVIPVYNHFAHTLACLRALAEHPPRVACEVIVVDDGSSDETADAPAADRRRALSPARAERRLHRGLQRRRRARARRHAGLPQQRHRAAAGLAGCAARHVRRRSRRSAWSARSCCTRTAACRKPAASSSPTAAAGTTAVSNPPTIRATPTCAMPTTPSGAAIAIPRALFAQLGGFDARYAPAYYEDTDLAFAVRARRQARASTSRPRACVHDEGTTAGTDTGSGIKAYQVAQPRALCRRIARGADRACRRRERVPSPGHAASPAAPGPHHRRADAAARSRFRIAAAGQPDADAARGRRARGVPAGQPRTCRPPHRSVAAARRRSRGTRRSRSARPAGCANTGGASIR